MKSKSQGTLSMTFGLEVPTRLVVYPGQSHGISKPSFRRDRLQRYLDWYGRWLQ